MKLKKRWDTVLFLLDQTYLRLEIAGRSCVAAKRRSARHPKLTLITTDYPPVVSGGIYRAVGWVTTGKARGWEVDVFVPRGGHQGRSSDPYMAARGKAADKVVEVPRPEIEYKRSWIPGDVHGGIDHALETARAVRRNTTGVADLVMASGPYFMSFVAAYWLAKLWQRPLVLDYRDEWTTIHHDLVQRSRGLDKLWEARCLRLASWVVTTTQAQRDNLIRGFGFSPDDRRFLVIPNGWDLEDTRVQATTPEFADRSSGIQIGYFGQLRKMTFFPALIRVLQQKNWPDHDRPQLHVFGDVRVEDGDLDDAVEARRIILHGNVPKSSVCPLMAQMDVLVASFVDGFGDYLPAKLSEYLATDLPILFIGPDGEAASLIKKLGAGRHVVLDDEEATREALDDLINAPAERYATRERHQWRENNERKVLMGALLDRADAHLRS